MKNRYKYPRTPHLPWSSGTSKDDKVLKEVDMFNGKNVVVTLKMDGENTSFYNDGLHARSIDSKDHQSRHWVKAFHSMVATQIPDEWRVCGENLFAKHSIFYDNLPSYFLAFSIWRKDECLDWELTRKLCNDWNIYMVPVIYEGVWSGNMEEILADVFRTHEKVHEGYVIRTTDSFLTNEFGINVAKFVRKHHVQTNKHWMYQKVETNRIQQ
jgi:hypothetical protein